MLRKISFFSNMSDFDLQQIIEIVTEKEYGADETVLVEKQEADYFYIIVRGKVEISKQIEDGEKTVLSIQSDGGFFGEIAILDEGRRYASVTTLEPTTVLLMRKDDFEMLLFKAPILAQHLLRELSTRIRESAALLTSYLNHRNNQMYRAYIDTMTMIVQSIEERSALTVDRSNRVTALAMILGREAGLKETDLFMLELSSLLHDLGMLTIPEKMLEKQRALSQDELERVQTHTHESINMIASIPMLQKIVPFIRHHHEHFDGTGYPDGLVGENIPKISRILAIADAFESMRRERPYRKQKTEQEALQEIEKLSGSQFDPEIVKLFLRIQGFNKIRPDEIPETLEEVNMSMNTSDFLLQNAEDSRIALIEADKTHTYAELKASAARLAGELVAQGFKPGDAIGILGPNSLFWIAAYLAIMKLSMVAVPFSIMLTPDDIGKNAQWAACKAVFMDRRQIKAFETAFPASTRLLYDDILTKDGNSVWPETADDFNGSIDASLMFTSGTTAKPKAVRITHDNIQANTESIIEYLKLTKDDCMLVILPFFYCFGTSLLHTHLRMGGRLALCNSFTFPETALDMMEREQCTGFAGVPSSFQLLLRISSFKSRSLPHLRLIQQAGGKLHNVLLEELIASKPATEIFIMYGQTEATARLSYLPPEVLHRKMGSIGKGIPGVRLRVVDEKGDPVKPGETGEIYASGRSISPGYLNDPEATAAKFVNGELRTGDLATVDEDGYIFVVDRKEDFIKSWGYRVSSQEVESCVLGIQDIVSAAAVGVPDLSAGEAIHVFITVKPGADVKPEMVIARCRSRLGKHMVPQTIHIIKSMPLNSNGKVVKNELRKMATPKESVPE